MLKLMPILREGARWGRESPLRAALAALLWAPALFSIAQGFVYAAHYSTDFQWSPAALLHEGVNPYAVALSGNPGGRILMSQFPPYLHELYIVMLPLAFLPYLAAKWVWAMINLGFAVASLVILSRRCGLSHFQGAIFAALFFFATPYRNAVGNGQTSLLCLFAFLLAWSYQVRGPLRAGASLSLLLTKYSFAPPIALWFLLRGKATMLLTSAALLTAGWLAFSALCHESPLTILAQPLAVANLYSESGGGGDVMTLIQAFGLDQPVIGPLRLGGVAGLLAAVLGVAALRARGLAPTSPQALAALSLVAMISIRHLAYDFVFLAPVGALAFVLPRLSQAGVAAALAYIGFGLKLLTGMGVSGKWVDLASCLALALMLVIVLSASPRKPAGEGAWPA